MTPFIAGERDRASRWKLSTSDLPGAARADADAFTGEKVIPGPFPYCIPPTHTAYNLLPSARNGLDVFRELGIPWHAGVAGGPANHLLDSQVQCVNALAPLMHDRRSVEAFFASTLDIAEVLEIERGWYLTFEWIGNDDHLGERRGQTRTRGKLTTSADAAIRYRATSGEVEVALIEWKYTEDYTDKQLYGGVGSLERRMARYRPLWDAPACPIGHAAMPYGEYFHEPRYQLLRLQLLADRMERAGELGTARVRLVVAAPRRNLALADDLARWPRVLRHPDRFAHLDTDALLRPGSVAGDDYRRRYG